MQAYREETIMFCIKCGKENAQGAAFCIGCGNALGAAVTNQTYIKPTAAAISKPVNKGNAAAIALGALSVVLAIALVLSLTGVIAISGAAGAASKSFSSPEDAIEYFVERMKNGDWQGALSACAIDEMARGFDYEAQAERLKVLIPIVTSYMPSEYKQYVEYNKCLLTQRIMMQMASVTASANLSEENYGLINGTPTVLEDGNMPHGLMEELDPENIKSVELIDIGQHRLHDSQVNRENQRKQAKIYSADDLQFRAVLYKFKGDYYIGGFTLIEYGGRWLIQNMSDPLAGIPAYGTPVKVADESEFYEMLE